MLVNTTLVNIENEINGAEDSLNERFDRRDYIRLIDVENVDVISVRKSYEQNVDKYVNSIIVILVNETESNPSMDEWQYSVWRYWQDPSSNWIEYELMFNLE